MIMYFSAYLESCDSINLPIGLRGTCPNLGASGPLVQLSIELGTCADAKKLYWCAYRLLKETTPRGSLDAWNLKQANSYVQTIVWGTTEHVLAPYGVIALTSILVLVARRAYAHFCEHCLKPLQTSHIKAIKLSQKWAWNIDTFEIQSSTQKTNSRMVIDTFL